MRLQRIRRNVVIALCADDELMEQLVLKGGNALDLVHGVGGRTSWQRLRGYWNPLG